MMMKKTSFCPQAMLFTMSYLQYCNDYFFPRENNFYDGDGGDCSSSCDVYFFFFTTNTLQSFVLGVLVSCSANARPRRGHTRLE